MSKCSCSRTSLLTNTQSLEATEKQRHTATLQHTRCLHFYRPAARHPVSESWFESQLLCFCPGFLLREAVEDGAVAWAPGSARESWELLLAPGFPSAGSLGCCSHYGTGERRGGRQGDGRSPWCALWGALPFHMLKTTKGSKAITIEKLYFSLISQKADFLSDLHTDLQANKKRANVRRVTLP